MPLALRFSLLLVLLATGCRYSGPYVTEETEIRVVWAGGASTTVYSAAAEPGSYRFERFEGTAQSTTTGGTPWGLAAFPSPTECRPVAQPLGTDKATLEADGDGVTLTFAGGATCRLKFISGTWGDYTAGRDVVLQLTKTAWDQWMSASQNAFLAHVDELRRRVDEDLESDQELTEARVADFVLEEDPLIRANRRQLLLFFEPLRIEGGFAVTERRRDPDAGWRFADYDLTPGAEQFLASCAAVTAYAAVEIGTHLLFCARGVGRACLH